MPPAIPPPLACLRLAAAAFSSAFVMMTLPTHCAVSQWSSRSGKKIAEKLRQNETDVAVCVLCSFAKQKLNFWLNFGVALTVMYLETDESLKNL